MKLLPLLVLQLAVSAGTVVVYDQLSDRSPGGGAPLVVETVDLSRMDARLRALESRRAPLLQASVPDAGLLDRIEALEQAQRGNAAPPQQDLASAETVPDAELDSKMGEPVSSRKQLTPEEVERFRKLASTVRREDALKKNRARVNQLLDKADIRLSERQREQVHTAYAAFQPRVGEIWGEAKAQAQATIAAGGHVERSEVVATTTALIESEFATILGQSMSGVDTQSIAEAVMSRGK